MKPIQADILARFKPTPVGAQVARCAATVTLVSLRFTSDHGLLTNKFTLSKSTTEELDRWLPGGTPYREVDPRQWALSPSHTFPISHTRGKRVSMVAEFAVGPATVRPGPAFVTFDGGHPYLRVSARAQFFATNATRTNLVPVALEADGPLPDLVQRLQVPLGWQVEFCKQVVDGGTGPFEIYVTDSTPEPAEDIDNKPEPRGVTLQRMAAAVRLATEAPLADDGRPLTTTPPKRVKLPGYDGSRPTEVVLTREHQIVLAVANRYPFYRLRGDRSLIAFGHAHYLKKETGGAWPMVDYADKSGECQAIIRLVLDVIRQIGLPGTAKVVYVYADPQSPGRALEKDTGDTYPPDSGYSLTDGPVLPSEVGTRYPWPDSPIGFNNYEACLKYEYAGTALYVPGGTSGAVWTTAQQVLQQTFYNFVHLESARYPDDRGSRLGWKLKKVLWNYREPQMNRR